MKGIIQNISTKYPPKVGVQIDDTWHNSFDKKLADYKKGDSIEYDLVKSKDGQYTNLILKEDVPARDINSDIQPKSSPMIATPVINLKVESWKLAMKLNIATGCKDLDLISTDADNILMYLEEKEPKKEPKSEHNPF